MIELVYSYCDAVYVILSTIIVRGCLHKRFPIHLKTLIPFNLTLITRFPNDWFDIDSYLLINSQLVRNLYFPFSDLSTSPYLCVPGMQMFQVHAVHVQFVTA